MPALKKMKVTVASTPGLNGNYFFMSNPLLYASIGTIVGIVPATATETQVVHRTEDLSLYGVLETIAVIVGNTVATRKTVKLYCAANKIVTAESELIGKVIPQGTITGISADLKAEEYIS